MPIDLRPIIPAAIVAFTGLVVLLAQAFTPRGGRAPSAALSLTGLAGALLSVVVIARGQGRGSVLGGSLAADDFALFFHFLILGIGVVAVLLSPSYLRATRADRGEYYALMMFSIVGMLGLASCLELVALFVALEIMSVAIYAMAGLQRDRVESQEAAVKYFITGAFSSAFFLYGIALLYGVSGSTTIARIATAIGSAPSQGPGLALLGVGFLLVGFGFKVAAVPFHMWAPDVYEGAPTTVTALMSAGVKAAAFAAFLRVFLQAVPAAGRRMAAGGGRPGHRHHGDRQPRGAGPDQHQEDAGLFLRRPRRLHPDRGGGGAGRGDGGHPLLPGRVRGGEPRRLRRCCPRWPATTASRCRWATFPGWPIAGRCSPRRWPSSSSP